MKLNTLLTFLTAPLLMFPFASKSSELLTVDDYLNQVRKENQTYQGELKSQQSSLNKKVDAELITSWSLESAIQFEQDKKISSNPSLTYDSLNTNMYSLGLSKTTTFGLNTKIAYDIVSTKYNNSNISSLGGYDDTFISTPTITLTQSLWQNKMGSLTQQNIEYKKLQSDYSFFNSQSNLDVLAQNARMTYWSLVLQKEIVRIHQIAVEQAQAIFKYNLQQAKRNLGEEADVFTAKASLEAKKMDLQVAQDNEATLQRQFNQFRNRPATEDPDTLMNINFDYLSSFRVEKNKGERADIKAAKAQYQMNTANAKILEENNKPTLNAYLSYGLNGLSNDNLAKSINDTLDSNRPTTLVGLKFSMPLDNDSLKKSTLGAYQQAQAAEALYQQKLSDMNADWEDLNAKIKAGQRKLKMAETIEIAQKKKVDFERERLHMGRTSTYQVLLYEQDYTSSQLSKVQVVNDIIALLARLRLYNHIEGGLQ